MRFVSEPIEAVFSKAPDLRKKPPPPDAFLWRGQQFKVTGMLAEWTDPAKMSRGRGRIFCEVTTDSGRSFRLYYDRRPQDALRRRGAWYLYCELGSRDED